MSQPYSAAIADVQGDGREDVVVAYRAQGTDKVMLYENNGNGTSWTPVTVGTCLGASYVAVAPMNGNGVMDILAAGRADEYIHCFESSLTPGSSPSTPITFTPVTVNPNNPITNGVNYGGGQAAGGDILAADINGDGLPDVIVDEPTNGALTWYENLGNGKFGPRQVIANISQPMGFAVGDLNGDGLNDIALGTWFSNSVIVYQNNGGGASWTPYTVSSGVQNDVYSVQMFDANGNGNLDLLTTSTGDNVVGVYMNRAPSQDTTPPTVAIEDPAPNPRSAATGVVTLQFSESVWGVTIGDLSLTRNGVPVSLAGLSLVEDSQATYSINLSSVTDASGSYTLTMAGAGSGIKDLAGNALAVGASDSWVAAPVLALSGPASVAEGSTYTLTLGPLMSPNPQPPSEYIIHWGDSTTTTVTSRGAVTHVYASPAQETISVDVVDPDGTHPGAGLLGVSVLDVAPTTSFNAPTTSPEGTPITLLGTATDPSPAETLAGFVYTWMVTNNGVAVGAGTGSAFTFTPELSGTYVVSLTATDEYGEVSAPVSQSIDVTTVAPTASFQAPAVVDQGGLINLSLTGPYDPSTVDTAAGFTYAFNFGQGYGPFGTSATASAPADTSGVIAVGAEIQDAEGVISQYVGSVLVRQGTELSAVSGAGTFGGSVTLLATLSAGGLALAGEPVAFTYDDGTSITTVGVATTNGLGVATLGGINLPGLNAGDDAGSIVASFAGQTNLAASTGTGDLMVQQAPLVVTADDATKMYGEADPAFTAQFSGLVSGDGPDVLGGTLSFTTTATAASQVRDGGYSIVPGGLTSNNYAITYLPGTLTITAAPLTITAANQSMTYGANLPRFTASYSGLVNGDTSASLGSPPTLTTTATSASPVGSYSINVRGAQDSDYSITYAPGTLTITPAPLTITAVDQTMIYGGTLPALTVSYSGLVNGDTPASLTTPPTLTTTATAANHVGSYAINVGGAQDSNYTITYVAGTLTITPAPLTIAAVGQSMTYGGALPALTATYSGFVNGDTSFALTVLPTLTTSATAASHVGSYAITVGVPRTATTPSPM